MRQRQQIHNTTNRSCINARLLSLVAVAVGLFCATPTLQAQWQQSGGPVGVSTMGIAAEGEAAILATSNGEIYRHQNETWMRSGQFPELEYKRISQRGSDLWVLQNGVVLALYNGNVIRSTDYGASWEAANIDGSIVVGDGTWFYTVVDDPDFEDPSKLYRSSDGLSWQELGNQPSMSSAPTVFQDAMFVTFGYGIELLRSSDNGANWDTLGPQLPREWRETSAGAGGILNIAANDEYLYGASGAEVFVSTNGMNWTNISGNLPEPLTITAILTSGDDLYIRTQSYDLYRYNGSDWEKIDVQNAYRLSSTGDGGLLVATFTGELFQVDANSLNVSAVSGGLIRTSIYGLGAVNNVLIASASGKLYRSTDQAETWDEVEDFGGWTSAQFRTEGDDIYALAGTVHRSTDNGQSWHLFGPRYDFELEGHNYRSNISAIGSNDEAIYLGISEYNTSKGSNTWAEGGVWRSKDGGETWEEASSGLPYVFTPAPIGNMIVTDDYLLVNTAAGIYRSVNGGDSWVPAMNGISKEDRDYQYGSGVAIQVAGKLILNMRYGMYESNDGGVSWQSINAPLPTGLEWNPVLFNLDDELYMQTYRRDDNNQIEYHLVKYNGNEWADVSDWQPEGVLFTSMIRMGDQYFGGTSEHGVWWLSRDFSIGTSGVASGSIDNGSTRLQVMPNPVTSEARITISTSRNEEAYVQLLDELGRSTGIDQTIRSAKESELTLDLSGLSSGTYYLQITFPDGTTIRQNVQVVH